MIAHEKFNKALERPRLKKIMEEAVKFPLVAVVAGAGYGKTHMVHSFLENYDAHVSWVQLSENDNLPARYWETSMNAISKTFPQILGRMKEIGFPESDKAFAKLNTGFRSLFNEQMNEKKNEKKKWIVVLDDFHLIKDPAVLKYIERAIGLLSPYSMMIILSRAMPDINIVEMMQREQVFFINEDTLCFSEHEIDDYFRQLKISFSRQDVHQVYSNSKGWAFAINLVGRALSKCDKRNLSAIEASKNNIYRYIEAEARASLSDSLWRFLIKLSLVDHHAASLVFELANNDELTRQMNEFSAYIRYDFNLDTYLIHHLFLKYLTKNQHILTDDEKREVYFKTAAWCDANGYDVDALSYYEKSQNYDAVLRKIAFLNVQIPLDMAQHAHDIIERMPSDFIEQSPIFWAMSMKLKASLGRFCEAKAIGEKYSKIYEAMPNSDERNCALASIYGIWAFLEILTCTYSDKYNFDSYFQKMIEYNDKCFFEIFSPHATVPVVSWVLPVGTNRAGAFEEYLAAIRRSIPHLANLPRCNLYGFDDLILGEMYYYRNELGTAKEYIKTAFEKACLRNQYMTQSKALIYLMLIAFSKGDYLAALECLKKLKLMLDEKSFSVRYTIYDIASSYFYLAVGDIERMDDWLKGDFEDCAHPVFLEDFANRIKILYHYHTKQYKPLLKYFDTIKEKKMVLLARIELKVLEALSLFQLKKRQEAIVILTEAYHLAKTNSIMAPFIQFSKDMRMFSAAVLKDDSCTIPKEWLQDINRKASALSKRWTKMMAEYRRAHQLTKNIKLSPRELAVLKDLVSGLSRSEIAADQNISINTVKMVTNIVYEKLNANNLADAIRIAIEKKLV